MSKLQIEPNKAYINRSGRKVTVKHTSIEQKRFLTNYNETFCSEEFPPNAERKARGEFNYYDKNGKCIGFTTSNRFNVPYHSQDLIAEYGPVKRFFVLIYAWFSRTLTKVTT